MKRLKILLQSNVFLIVSLILIILYVFIFTKVISYKSKYTLATTNIEGYIMEYSIDGDKLSILVKAREKVKATFYIKTKEEKEKLTEVLKIGMKVNLNGKMIEPKENTIPNTFNYKRYLYNHRIYYLFQITNFTYDNDISFLYKIKNLFRSRVNSLEKTSGYMHAFILGDSSFIDNAVYENYQNNGVTHLFAVSGMHIGIFIMVLDKLFKKVKRKDIIIASIIFFYLFLVGFSSSAIRATLFCYLLKINKKLQWRLDARRILYLLFLFLVIINPFYIYDLGFLYSFTTSYGLILFQSKIRGNYFKKLFLVSLYAFLFSLPISIYNFYEFNLLTVLNNILIVPIVSTILFPLSLITFILPFLEPILGVGFNILELLSNLLNLIQIQIVVPKIGIVFFIIYYLIIYLIYKYHLRNIIFLAILIFIAKLKPYIDSSNYVYFLDVGQGDSSLIISSHASDVIMVDTGGNLSFSKEEWQMRNKEFQISKNIMIFIKSLGLSHIDFLIASHGDFDHLGDGINLINNFKVKNVIFNCGSHNSLEKELIKVLENKNINYSSCIKELNFDNNKLYFLNTKEYNNENDNSSVFYTELNSYKFLFMGDASTLTEKEILEKYNLPNIDILKVGHHGSKTSSSKEFINKINPKYSIISVGENNRYGHPNKEVLDNLINSIIYRTDIDGSIIFKTKNNKLKIKTCPP